MRGTNYKNKTVEGNASICQGDRASRMSGEGFELELYGMDG